MSKNKKQAAQSAKPQAKQSTASEAEQIKDNLKNVQASLKDSIDAKSTDTAANSPTETADKKPTAAKDSGKPAENAVEKTAETAKAKVAAKTDKPAATTTATAKKQPEKPAQQTAKKGGAGVLLALLLGVAGTGLGAYSFNELRNLKASNTSNDYAAKLAAIEGQLANLDNNDAGTQQLTELLSQVKSLKAAETGFNERMAKVEQAQAGTATNITATVEQQLAAMEQTVKTVQEQVDAVKLGQQGLVKNINDVTAGSQSVTDSGMAKQEIGYLLRMANYKLSSERDVSGATGLLQIAADKLLAANQGQTDALIDAIRAKIIQLQGVTMTDENALIAQLGQVSRDIPLLVVKSQAAESTAANTTEATAETEAGALDKITAMITSGIKYTPKDPSKIDISAETVLIEKRLMQADVKTAEFAVRSHNKTLLSESFRSIRDTLDKYFADDATAQGVKTALNGVEQSELSVVLPNLSDVIRQFEQNQ